MGMANMLVNRLEELGSKIDALHLMYLEIDESPKKIEHRERLEHCIKEFLFLAPHDMKFAFRQTADVLHRSASTKDNFSGYRAGVAWKALGKYADNLLAQPWRKEYREIKLYCGFYKHEIEANLVGAELMLEAMGYRHSTSSTMILPDILDPDRITNVSRDAITAYVECQIMKEVWEAVGNRYNFSWIDILEFRENHTGTPDQAIKALNYKARQRQYQEAAYHHHRSVPEIIPHPDCYYGGYNHMPHYPSYTMPRYSPMVNPPPPVVYQHYTPQTHVLKPQDLYPTNGYHHMHPQYNAIPHNGYAAPVPVMPTYTAPTTVPTAQLIEVDMLPSASDCYIQRGKTERAEPIRHESQVPSGRAKDDGAGSWENWDYVYRNLESQGYKKDMGSRGDLLSPKETEMFSERLKKLQVEPVISKKDVLVHKELEVSETDNAVTTVQPVKVESPPREVSPLKVTKTDINRISPKKTKLTEAVVVVNIPEVVKVEKETPPREVERKSQELSGKKKDEIVKKQAAPRTEGQWDCITCTYLNAADQDVCEMCCKSRVRGPELRPQPTGGQVCSQCTFVNEPGHVTCSVCESSLENSPTYI